MTQPIHQYGLAVPNIIHKTTKVIPDSIDINKKSALNFCMAVMLQLASSTTSFNQSIMSVLQENTNIQQIKTSELANLPLLKVPKLELKDKPEDNTDYKNNVEVSSLQNANKQIEARRQLLQQELAASQQRAQANQKLVNSNSSIIIQLIQANSALLESVQKLTINALLTRPARGS